MHILIAEDDLPVAKFVSSGLESEHYGVTVVPSGDQALRALAERAFDLMVLDLNLPGRAGLDVLRELRCRTPHLPVLILTGSGRVEDRVEGLDLGADDYLTKPFAFAELLARIRALLRRSGVPFEPVLHHRDLELDRVQRTVQRNGKSIALTPKEFGLLEYLMLNAGRIVSRASILENVWKMSSDTLTNVVDVYINYIRKKVDSDTSVRLIHTVRGAGYRLGSKMRAAS